MLINYIMKKENYFHFIMLLIIILFISVFAIYNESFSNNVKNKNGLFGARSLDRYCKSRGLRASFMPASCLKRNGYYSNQRNCKCIGDDGYCDICFPKIKTRLSEF